MAVNIDVKEFNEILPVLFIPKPMTVKSNSSFSSDSSLSSDFSAGAKRQAGLMLWQISAENLTGVSSSRSARSLSLDLCEYSVGK